MAEVVGGPTGALCSNVMVGKGKTRLCLLGII